MLAGPRGLWEATKFLVTGIRWNLGTALRLGQGPVLRQAASTCSGQGGVLVDPGIDRGDQVWTNVALL